MLPDILFFLIGAVVGAGVVVVLKARRIATLEANLEAERRIAEERRAAFDQSENRLKESFSALASEALQKNSESFVLHAKSALETSQQATKTSLAETVAPLTGALEKITAGLGEMGRDHASVRQMVLEAREAAKALQTETGKLVRALRTPDQRGRWGEVQLRRAVELSGMLNHVDFVEQAVAENSSLRPDMIVHLPGAREIVVDSKTPLDAYLDTTNPDLPEDERTAALARHARHVREHIKSLSAKAYWTQFENAPEFVILFLPAESMFSAALAADPALIEDGFTQKIIIATPTTLVALLRAVAFGWRQEALAANARQISDLGRQLYERLSAFTGHLQKMHNGLKSAIGAYNDGIGSLERSVFPMARRFPELGLKAGKDMPEPPPLDIEPRALSVAEMTEGTGNGG